MEKERKWRKRERGDGETGREEMEKQGMRRWRNRERGDGETGREEMEKQGANVTA